MSSTVKVGPSGSGIKTEPCDSPSSKKIPPPSAIVLPNFSTPPPSITGHGIPPHPSSSSQAYPHPHPHPGTAPPPAPSYHQGYYYSYTYPTPYQYPGSAVTSYPPPPPPPPPAAAYYPPPSAPPPIPNSTGSVPLPNPFSIPPPNITTEEPKPSSSSSKHRHHRDYSDDPERSSRRRSSNSSGRHRHDHDDYDRHRRHRSRGKEEEHGRRYNHGHHHRRRSRSPRPSSRHRRSRSRSPGSSRRTTPPPPQRRRSLAEEKGAKHGRSRQPSPGDDQIPKTAKEMFEQRMKMSAGEIIQMEKKIWTRSAPADLYYQRDPERPLMMRATEKLQDLCDRFEKKCINPAEEARRNFTYKPPKILRRVKKCKKHGCGHDDHSSDSSSSDDEGVESSFENTIKDDSMAWLEHRQNQPDRLCKELWGNRSGEVNDGPACRCSVKARKTGIRHGIYQGETKPADLDPMTNNSDKLFHYRIAISPPTNFLVKTPTILKHDGHEFIFEGFSLFTTQKINDLPICKVVRFNIEYSILFFEEKVPDNFTLRELKLFHRYFFHELLELLDWDVSDLFFFMPRFVRDLTENGKEILSMNEVIKYLEASYKPLIDDMEIMDLIKMDNSSWLDYADSIKGMLVTSPGMKPSTLRVDQLDREQDSNDVIKYPEIVHFGSRPPQLSYAGSSDYQKAWREYVKYRHLLANMAKPQYKDKRQLEAMEERLGEMRSNTKLKREVTVGISSQGFFRTGLMTDIVQHGLFLPVFVNHLRLHASLDHLEERIKYKFKNRHLLQLAFTHPSYKENFGTIPDHARNTLSNCGIRQPEYGDKKIHLANSRKRGINMLISIMSKFGRNSETESKVKHNERLEFLGDAVVEFITSVHLFYMFPDLEEGGLATYRAALVQNQHLAILAQVLGLEKYMLYAHGSDLCHDSELRHAMANCFEALMGAVFLDGNINEADRIFSDALFGADEELFQTWVNLQHHPLQRQEPEGDRHWIESYPLLKKLTNFEVSIGVEFKHVRLLARAFTDRSLGYSNLTLGSNQRMEFLGDTVLQLVSSDYLYKHFPEHHEGHLSLLRSSIVNNKTQAVVCDDIGIPLFANYANPKHELKTKDRADLLESLLGALYVDKDLEYCKKFAEVCFFPRLTDFIINQEWNDPKSKLQQCCLTLRTMNGGDPDIPIYKVVEAKGPTNTRVYSVVVYFRNERLASAEGHSIQEAEMNAAQLALESSGHLFPHLSYQKKIVERSFQRQTMDDKRKQWQNEVKRMRKELGLDEMSRRKDERRKREREESGRKAERPAKMQRKAKKEEKQPKIKKTIKPINVKPKVVKKEKKKAAKTENNAEKEEGELSSDDEDSSDEGKEVPSGALANIMEYDSVSSDE